jgi:hypothetical protein
MLFNKLSLFKKISLTYIICDSTATILRDKAFRLTDYDANRFRMLQTKKGGLNGKRIHGKSAVR